MPGASVDEILFQLTHLPQGVNPFAWLENFLSTVFLPQYTPSARTQLYLIIALHAFSVVVLLASLFLRYRKGQFWLFRWQLSHSLIEVNLATVPAIAALVEIACESFLEICFLSPS